MKFLKSLLFIVPAVICLTATSAQADITQIALTETLIHQFIRVQPVIREISERMHEGQSDKETLRQMEKAAQDHGFKNLADLEDTYNSIGLVLDNLDMETGAFTDPREFMKQEIESIKSDATIPEEDKAKIIEEIEEEIRQMPIILEANIELVRHYRFEINDSIWD